MVGLLNEMTAKFQEEPPLSTKPTEDNPDPHVLLDYVNNLQLTDGDPPDRQTDITMIDDESVCYCQVDRRPFQVERGVATNR